MIRSQVSSWERIGSGRLLVLDAKYRSTRLGRSSMSRSAAASTSMVETMLPS
jgi:hypothetical protein